MVVSMVLSHNAVELIFRNVVGYLREDILAGIHKSCSFEAAKLPTLFQIKKSKNALKILNISKLKQLF